MKKPDRFERKAQRCVPMVGNPDAYRLQVQIFGIALRLQYAALRRLVKKQQRWEQMVGRAGLTTGHDGRWIDCKDLLDAMDKWKRGTK